MPHSLPPAVFIAGPTASGKTDLAIALAEHLPVELISVDSALIYRGMDIGTAKPEPELLARYPHQLVDILDPLESYSAAQFCQDALPLMQQATEQGRLPVLVGGTMLYFKALQEGLANMPPADEPTRQQLEQEIEQDGLTKLYQQLLSIDPVAAARIDANDKQRIMRALEVWRVSGKTLTEHHQQQAHSQRQLPYTVSCIALAPQERAVLHQRIALRFQLMLEQGFIEEVEALRQRSDLHLELPSMRSVGYRQVWKYLEGEYDYSEMVERGIIATRQLAKRQFTWLRSWPEVNWLDSLAKDNLSAALKIIQASTM